MDKKSLNQKRIHIIVTPELHKEIKRRALDRNITASKYILDAVRARIRGEIIYEKQPIDTSNAPEKSWL
jgi:hypothetical protein